MKKLYTLLLIAALILCAVIIACDEEEAAPAPAPDELGSYQVGTTMRYITDSDRTEFWDSDQEKIIPVQVWYPATDEAANLEPLLFLDFFPDEFKEQSIEDMVYLWSGSTTLPDGLDSLETNSVEDAAANASGGPYPLIIFSHGHMEMRFSWFSMAEYLASHGYVVVGIDHVGNACASSTPGIYYDHEPTSLALLDFYHHRLDDVISVLDGMAEINTSDELLKGMVNSNKAAIFGHSYGAITSSGSVVLDNRLKCAMPVAAGMHPLDDNQPLGITKPMMFMIADHENATTLMGGNDLVRQCYDAALNDKYYLTSLDSGHFTYTDICNVDPEHGEGCGEGYNDVGDYMTYVDTDLVHPVFNTYATAFFGRYLKNYTEYNSFLQSNIDDTLIEIEYSLQ